MANLIIDKTDFAGYADIAANIDDTRINTWIEAAQYHDLRKILGKVFYADVETQAGEVTPLGWYTTLRPYLVPVLCYYAYARQIEESNSHSTRYGERIKLNPHSEPESLKDRGIRADKKRSQAADYAQDLIEHLEDNLPSYPVYRDNRTETTKPRGGIRISSTTD